MLVLCLVFFSSSCRLLNCGQGIGIHVCAVCLSLGPMASLWPPFGKAMDFLSLLLSLLSVQTCLIPPYPSQEMEIINCSWELQDPKNLSSEPHVFSPHTQSLPLYCSHTPEWIIMQILRRCGFFLSWQEPRSVLPLRTYQLTKSSRIAFFQFYH